MPFTFKAKIEDLQLLIADWIKGPKIHYYIGKFEPRNIFVDFYAIVKDATQHLRGLTGEYLVAFHANMSPQFHKVDLKLILVGGIYVL